MPPGKVLQPVLKMKVDELFLYWLSEASTQRMLQDRLHFIKASGRAAPGAGDAGPREAWPPAYGPATPNPPRDQHRHAGASARAAPGSHRQPPQRPQVCGPQSSPGKEGGAAAPSHQPQHPSLLLPPRAHQGHGECGRHHHQHRAHLRSVPSRESHPGGHGQSSQDLWLPAVLKGAAFLCGECTGSVSVHKFVALWRKILQNCHDDTAKFVHLLLTSGCNYLVQEDFVPFLQDVVNTHPGLSFLKEASEFHSRYITTAIQRICYTVNRSCTGRITCTELWRSTCLQNVALLEEEVDINQLTEYFSYEHFYVIYCKFWKLHTHRDLLIDAQDLAGHNDHAFSAKMIDRIFSGAVTRGRKVQKEGKISYADFVWFLISKKDKKTPTSIEYWFRCMDLDGDGALSMFELEYFYEEQCRRLESMAIDALPFEDCLCQMLDLVKPQSEVVARLRGPPRASWAQQASREGHPARPQTVQTRQHLSSLTRSSTLRVPGPRAERAGLPAEGEREPGPQAVRLGEVRRGGVRHPGGGGGREEAVGPRYEEELSPVDQKLSALRCPLAQRPFFEVPTPLGDVDLCEYVCGEEDLQPL
ncbi:Serine/threonine-protein phosphatase 2A regulatory subunit B'' subunit beta [Sciurus carolinensis]|uniref:Serine/threonine-protein phosphatase 2A regulatory subunit B'' subunit beta n=1 Tax=Sciurus carolinensis TaxID=30640 RepID=A0AA41NBS3_SCICA|nr:Serine/threonine-protein phosphatase 2A regulatory subunit B'' subunit beta [Sciurus carolinensis]